MRNMGKCFYKKLAADLTKKFGKGFGYVNLNLMRQFYLTYPSQTILQTVSEVSFETLKFQTASGISENLMLEFSLSLSYYCLLMRLDEPFKRGFYEAECFRGKLDRRDQL